jgi:hypothetical protein
MADGFKTLQACLGCQKACKSSYCDKCKAERQPIVRDRANHRNDDPCNKMYQTARWRKLSNLLRDFNPVCLHVINGVQCRYPSKLVHHKISPRVDPSQFYSVPNLVPICFSCHPDDAGDTRGYIYKPTKWMFGAEYPHG